MACVISSASDLAILFTEEVTVVKKCKSLLPSVWLMFAVAIVIVAFYAISNSPRQARGSQQPLEPQQPPTIQIQDQPESPLGIVSAKGNLATAHVPQVELVIVNRSVQPVRAYTLRYQTISGHSKGGGTDLTSSGSVNALLQPGRTASTIVGEGTSYTDPIAKIVVSVDFVELADGSTWGPDESKSSEMLAGQRAGAHQAIEWLTGILNKQGPLAVMQSIETGIHDVVPPPGKSAEWLTGFDGGRGAVKERVMTAYGKSGVGAIESELRRPFDASDRR